MDAVVPAGGVDAFRPAWAGTMQDEIPDDDQMAGSWCGHEYVRGTAAVAGRPKPDLIMYGCTSATLTHGAGVSTADLAARIKSACSGADDRDGGGGFDARDPVARRRDPAHRASPRPMSARSTIRPRRSLRAMGIETVQARRYWHSAGQLRSGGANARRGLRARPMRADGPEAEAIVLSCTDMRSRRNGDPAAGGRRQASP